MGRRRLHSDPNEPLPPGLYKEGRKFRARLLGGPWQYFGTDYVAAVAAYAAWRHEGVKVRTVGWLLDVCVGQAWPARVAAKDLAPRTLKDYKRDSAILKRTMGHIPLTALEPKHIYGFRQARAVDAPTHVRNEMGCLASALTHAVKAGFVATNVAREVERPGRKIRQRLISDAEYLAVYNIATNSERLAMALCLRTLALPDDALSFGPRNIVRYDERRTLRFARGKTKRQVEIEVVGELAVALAPFLTNPTAHPTFIRKTRGKDAGKRYTVSGIGAMFRRHCVKAGVKDFGLRDLRAKGATEMWRAGEDIRKISALLGHASEQTTRVYLKSLLPEIVRPNERPVIAEAK